MYASRNVERDEKQIPSIYGMLRRYDKTRLKKEGISLKRW
jgi:hypothetical protein